MRNAASFGEVVRTLGGPAAVARLCDRTPAAVCNWRRRGTFPSRLFFRMTAALRDKKVTAPRELWGFVPERGSSAQQSQQHAAA